MKSKPVYTINNVPYEPVLDSKWGIVLRKVSRRKQPSPGQLGLFSGHYEGETKTEDGVTYRLNANRRWEKPDKQAELKEIVPVINTQEQATKTEFEKYSEEMESILDEHDKIIRRENILRNKIGELTEVIKSVSPIKAGDLVSYYDPYTEKEEQSYVKEIRLVTDPIANTFFIEANLLPPLSRESSSKSKKFSRYMQTSVYDVRRIDELTLVSPSAPA